MDFADYWYAGQILSILAKRRGPLAVHDVRQRFMHRETFERAVSYLEEKGIVKHKPGLRTLELILEEEA